MAGLYVKFSKAARETAKSPPEQEAIFTVVELEKVHHYPNQTKTKRLTECRHKP